MNKNFLPSYTGLNKDDLFTMFQQQLVGYTGNKKPIIDFMMDICSLNDDIIYWSDISETITQYFAIPEIPDLVKGLQYLEDAQYLIMRNTNGAEEIAPTYIRLTEPNSTVFMCEWITERLVQASITPDVPLPFLREINKTKFDIPPGSVVPFIDVASTYKIELIPNLYNPRIFSLDLHSDLLFFTSYSIPFLDQLAINKLNNLLKLAYVNIFSMVSRICNISHINLIQSITEYNYIDLLKHAQTISQHYESLSKIPVLKKHSSFLEMISLLIHLLPLSIRHQQELKKQSEQSAQLYSTLTEDLVQKKVYTKFQFDTFLDYTLEFIYGNNTNEITYQKELYLDRYVATALKITSIEPDMLVDFNSHYILSNHIVNILVDDYPKARAKVIDLLSANIKNYLLGRNELKQTLIYSNASTETAIRQCLFKEFPVYYSIIKFPEVMLLAFHSSADNTVYAEEISRYFKLNSNNLLPWLDVFRINIRGLYLEVSRNLGILGRIVVGIKGTKSKLLQHLNKSQQNPL